MSDPRPIAAVFTPCTDTLLDAVLSAIDGINANAGRSEDLVLEVDPEASAILILPAAGSAPHLTLLEPGTVVTPLRPTSGDELRQRAAERISTTYSGHDEMHLWTGEQEAMARRIAGACKVPASVVVGLPPEPGDEDLCPATTDGVHTAGCGCDYTSPDDPAPDVEEVVVEADADPAVEALERAAVAAAPASKCKGCDNLIAQPSKPGRRKEWCSQSCERRVARDRKARRSLTDGGEVFECDDCGRPFSTQRGLSRHRTETHPITSPKVVDPDAARRRAAESM